MFFWLLESKRERIEACVTALIAMGVALALPSPKHETIDGKDVAIVTMLGWVVPQWVLTAMAIALVAIIYVTVRFVGQRLWPEPVQVEKVYAGQDGLTIGWVPDVPGTGSPLEYEPWTSTPETSAQAYLEAEGPNPMRVMMLGMEQADQEDEEFREAQERWVKIAPESTLRDLIPAFEQAIDGAGEEWIRERVYRVLTAYEERGIPSRIEIQAMVERLERRGLPKMDLDPWFADDESAPKPT